MNRALSAVCLLLLLSTSAFGQATTASAKPDATSKDNDGIRKVLADFIEAWNKQDVKAFARVFADDADFTNVPGATLHGRPEIEKFYAPLFAARYKGSNQKITRAAITFIKADVAVVDAWWEMTGAKGPAGQDIKLSKGLLTFVMIKDGDRWQIAVTHNVDLPDAQ